MEPMSIKVHIDITLVPIKTRSKLYLPNMANRSFSRCPILRPFGDAFTCRAKHAGQESGVRSPLPWQATPKGPLHRADPTPLSGQSDANRVPTHAATRSARRKQYDECPQLIWKK